MDLAQRNREEIRERRLRENRQQLVQALQQLLGQYGIGSIRTILRICKDYMNESRGLQTRLSKISLLSSLCLRNVPLAKVLTVLSFLFLKFGLQVDIQLGLVEMMQILDVLSEVDALAAPEALMRQLFRGVGRPPRGAEAVRD